MKCIIGLKCLMEIFVVVLKDYYNGVASSSLLTYNKLYINISVF